MYTVLMPVKTERSLETVAYLGSHPGHESALEVVVLNVFEEFETTDEAGVVRSSDLYEEVDLPASVVEVSRALEDRGVDVTVRREHGDPSEEILRVAEDVDADTILMAGPDRSPTGKAVFGSTVQDVLLGSGRPVTVVRAT